MRNKKLFYLFLILCSSFFVFTNCSDDDPKINNGVNEEEKPETPVSGTTIGFMRSGTLGIVIDSEESTYDYAFQVGFQGGMSQTDVSFVIQPWSETELDAYNAEKNSDYSLLPSEVYSMVGTVIPQGNNQTDVTVSFNPSAILSLIKETNSDYLLPLRLTSVDGDIAIDENTSNIFGSYVFANEILKYNENIRKLEELGGTDLTNNNFFRKCECNPNSIFYFDASKYVSSIDEVIQEIHDAGGLAFLAHAYIYDFENPKAEIENILKTTEIDGLECQYPLFTEEQRQEIMALCKKYNKYISGGSDYHGDRKPNIKMGTGIDNNLNIEKEFIQNWIEKVLIIP